MIIEKLHSKNLIHPPSWMMNNVQYLTTMGSVAYGVSADRSDNDVYGFCIPPKDDIFPHLRGEIPGFGSQKHCFGQWQEHGVKDTDSEKSYDFAVYSIVKYFHLVMQCNPNMVDSLFTDQTQVIHITQVGQMVRENRKMFLNKRAWHTYKGYSYAQIHKIKTKTPQDGSKRHADVQEHGWDTKFGYHVVRLLLEAEQILTEHDLDLQRNREQLKAIRRGEWTEQDVIDFFNEKEKSLEALYHSSTLRYSPDEPAIKSLLLQCLEHHFGSLDKAITVPDRYESAVRNIAEICRAALKETS